MNFKKSKEYLQRLVALRCSKCS